jgi:hypothetical protein
LIMIAFSRFEFIHFFVLSSLCGVVTFFLYLI